MSNLLYQQLENYLKNGQWREADEETYRVMIKMVGKEEGQWLEGEDLENFPCEDLRTINQLWLHYSNGKFGFSVQKEIYESLGSTIGYNEEVWKKFCDRVGWRKGGYWVKYSDLTFNLENAPQAHLPTGFQAGVGRGFYLSISGVWRLLSLANQVIRRRSRPTPSPPACT